MCLKYNLQETADCVSRQREAAMSSPHHTFLIDCDSGLCVCLTGAPQPLREGPSPQPPMVPSSRRLLRTRFTGCIMEQRAETPEDERSQDADASGIAKRKRSMGPLPKTTHLRVAAGEKVGVRSLQDSLKRWIQRLASCVCTE